MYITYEQIKDSGACPSQLELFANTFGKGARLTKRNLKKAVEVGLQLSWLRLWVLDIHRGENLKYTNILEKHEVRRGTTYDQDELDSLVEYFKLK